MALISPEYKKSRANLLYRPFHDPTLGGLPGTPHKRVIMGSGPQDDALKRAIDRKKGHYEAEEQKRGKILEENMLQAQLHAEQPSTQVKPPPGVVTSQSNSGPNALFNAMSGRLQEQNQKAVSDALSSQLSGNQVASPDDYHFVPSRPIAPREKGMTAAARKKRLRFRGLGLSGLRRLKKVI